MIEKDIENLMADHPDDFFPKEKFKLKGQQINADTGYADIVFEDKKGTTVIIEAKLNTLKKDAADQILKYRDIIKKEDSTKKIRLIVCANSIPSSLETLFKKQYIECWEFSKEFVRKIAEKYNYKFISEGGAKERQKSRKIFTDQKAGVKRTGPYKQYHGTERYDEIIRSGGSGVGKSSIACRNLPPYFTKAKKSKKPISVSSRQVCEHDYFGTRTRDSIIYFAAKVRLSACDFVKSDLGGSQKFMSFKLGHE